MKIVAKNKKAFFEYEILEKFEAGISLLGAEVKSLVGGGISLKESYVLVKDNELFLFNAHISRYKFSTNELDEYRTRKLLLKSKEIDKLVAKTMQKGLTLVPTIVYIANNHKVKIEIALAKGKKLYDKRRDMKEREISDQIKKAKKHGQFE